MKIIIEDFQTCSQLDCKKQGHHSKKRKQLSCLKTAKEGLHWGYSGSDSTLPMPGAQVPSLVRELRSQVPYGIPLDQEKTSKRRTWICYLKKDNKIDILRSVSLKHYQMAFSLPVSLLKHALCRNRLL